MCRFIIIGHFTTYRYDKEKYIRVTICEVFSSVETITSRTIESEDGPIETKKFVLIGEHC